MKQQTYTLLGMTCKSCEAKVKTLLQSVEGVERVHVSKEQQMVRISSPSQPEISQLEAVLPDKYKFNSKLAEAKPMSEWRQLYPLYLIFVYLTSAALLMQKDGFSIGGFMFDFMGLFFMVFSFFKFLDIKGFVFAFRKYDPLAKALPLYAWIYPFLEVGLGLVFLLRIGMTFSLMTTIVLLGITTVGVLNVLYDKKSIQCACLGTALKLPMTKATVIENVTMLFMSFWMLFSSFI